MSKTPSQRREKKAFGQIQGRIFEQVQCADGKFKFLTYTTNLQLAQKLYEKDLDYRHFYDISESLDNDTTIIPDDNTPYKPIPCIEEDTTKPDSRITKEELWKQVKSYIKDHLELQDERLYDVYTAFIFATWTIERWRTATYLIILGLHGTGKTRTEEVFNELCYHAKLISSITRSALFRIIDLYHPTMLLDQAEQYTDESKEDMMAIFNAGQRRGSPLTLTDKEDGMKLKNYDIFSFKVISGRSGYQSPLESRSIPVVMYRAAGNIRYEIDENRSKALRTQLLLYRLETMKTSDASDASDVSDASCTHTPTDTYLEKPPEALRFANGRFVEKFYPLYTAAQEIDEEATRNILEYAKSLYAEENEEDQISEDSEMLQCIVSLKDKLMSGLFFVKQVVAKFNEERTSKEEWKSKTVGTVIRRLGFRSRRGSRGERAYLWEEAVVDRQCRRFGLDKKMLYIQNTSDTSDTSEPSLIVEEFLCEKHKKGIEVGLAPIGEAFCQICGEPASAKYRFESPGQQDNLKI